MSKKKISIVGGLGHVGLPLAFMLASKKFDVTSIDIDKKKIDKIKINNKDKIEIVHFIGGG